MFVNAGERAHTININLEVTNAEQELAERHINCLLISSVRLSGEQRESQLSGDSK